MARTVYIRGEKKPNNPLPPAKVPQMKIKYLLINLSCKLDNLLPPPAPSFLFPFPSSQLKSIRGGVAFAESPFCCMINYSEQQ